MRLFWAEKLGKPECPYLIRWGFECCLFSIRLHHWRGSDDQRHPHDHPWNYISFVFRGGYTNVSPEGDKLVVAPTIVRFKAEHKHSVLVNHGGAWTLVFTGRDRREWGFWVNGKFRKRNKYFYMFGNHPCS